METVFLYPLVDQLTGFGQLSYLTIIHNLSLRYRTINEINLEENSVKMMGPYNPAEPLDQLIKQLEKGRELAQSGGQTIADAMMVSVGITLMTQTATFNEDTREWRHQATNHKTS